ncbi:hypothetical protein C8R45DRAFT_293369 [Mycena sanguinolenta]|nr:hypothetical protein C8R45DRAFT_293369 [Mycena sanguinolenta]
MQIMVFPRIACVNCCPLPLLTAFSSRSRSVHSFSPPAHSGRITHACAAELYSASTLRKCYVLLARNRSDADARPTKNLLCPYGPNSNHDCPRPCFEFVPRGLGIKRPLAPWDLSVCLFPSCNATVSVGWILVLADLYFCLRLELASRWFIRLRGANLARDGTLLACSWVS